MIISHLCYECNFQGELIVFNNQVQCPNCKTINDVWLEGESEPKRHIEHLKKYTNNSEANTNE